MRVWWCEEHDFAASREDLSPCSFVEKDLHPAGSRVVSGEAHEITLHPDVEIHNGKGESMGMGCYPRGDVVGGNGECAMFALPPGRYLLILDALADKEATSG